ncbi:MAG: hypothetical protein ACD_81C00136G0006 [uncultured bacterium]|uniref:DUF4153 domain-containing protein n=1 Tax=Candidatus Wolfebacteria bacterium GW2011_GWE2_44_13 TaxID=1619017 RepID=A0A0G1JI30_9BACT|nr:MAG: hypothetical protein ACD_81C00136G0006 [uncultured bacterium]KKT43627.1 MAG: hypothetical protein UW32_C0001G0219 [Candidatus Wolfebacteria bacterium GW2011_GWE2_44_13]
MKNILKLRAILSLIESLQTAARRFPFSFLFSIATVSAGLLLAHQVGNTAVLAKILITSILGFLLFISITLLCEQNNWSKKIRSSISLAGFGLLAGYYSYLPADLNTAEDAIILRSVLWGLCLVFLISFAPYIKKRIESASDKIWYFNAYLVISIALTIIWLALTQAGVSIALSAIGHLFTIAISEHAYQDMAIVLFSFFGPAFLLSRIPQNVGHTIESAEYPKELRLLLQYVFVPLVSLYFLILYAYVIRIGITQEWPVGTLAYMILGFSVLGMLVYICLYPLRNVIAWIRKAGDIFHMVLIPQIGMLFWALWFRISQYGITENRYYVLVAGFWLLALSSYFLISKKKDLRIIPVSLFLIALVSSFGPLGALAISERSQQNRLENLLVKNRILADDGIHAVRDADVSFGDKKEIGAITSYLITTHGKNSLTPIFSKEVLSSLAANREEQKKQVMEKFGLPYLESWASGQQNFYYNSEVNTQATQITQFDYAIPNQGMESTQTIAGVQYQFKINTAKNTFEVTKGGVLIAEKNLNAFLNTLSKTNTGSVPKDQIIIVFENDAIAFKYHIERIGGELSETGYAINLIKGLLLFTIK